jgi:CRP-like cAMP-binding protein
VPLHSQSALQLFLDRLTCRSVLSDVEQGEILNLPTQTVQIDAGRDFVRIDTVVDHTSLVVAGLVARFGQTSNGSRQITALHIPGDMANLQSVIQPKATSALQALPTSTVLRIPHAHLHRIAAAYPAIAEALWRDCVVDDTILAEWVVNVGRRLGRTRVAHLLCEMAFRYKAVKSPRFRFNLPMTQSQMADATGLTAVHVNRTLMSLVDDGVSVRRGTVYIENWEALAEAGEFDPAYLQADVAPTERLRIVRLVG